MKGSLIYASLIFLNIKFSLLPNATLLFLMFFAIGVDFATGFAKAYVLKQARTSTGMRRTITKFLQYGGGIVIGTILSQAAEQHKLQGAETLIGYFNDSLLVFIIYIEVTSIFENLIAIDSTSAIARFIYIPAHRVLTVQLKKIQKEIEAKAEKEGTV